MRGRRRRGVALLTVLLLVLVMSGLAVAVLDEVRFALRRSANAREVAQARWYALGAEALARTRIAQLHKRDPNRTTLAGDWEGKAFTFPIDNGLIEAEVFDAGNCFNLNSLAGAPAASDGDGFIADREPEAGEAEAVGASVPEEAGPPAAPGTANLAAEQFRALMQALNVNAGKANDIAAAATDWIDRDQRLTYGGGEDNRYVSLDRPYRTGDTLMTETSELRAVHGVDAKTYAKIRPFVCALPKPVLSPINVNTLRAEDAPLLVMLTRGKLSLSQARQIIAQRPVEGWDTLVRFWEQPALAQSGPGELTLKQAALRTSYFGLRLRVVFGRADVTMSALFEENGQGRARLVARRWTVEE